MIQYKLRERECNGKTHLRSLQVLKGKTNKRVYFVYDKQLTNGLKRILNGPGFPKTHFIMPLRNRMVSSEHVAV